MTTVASLVGKTINHSAFIKEICGTATTKTTRGIIGRQLDDVASQFHRTYIQDPEHLTEDTVMERILYDLHHQTGYRTSPFQQRCFAVFIKLCAPLIFSHSRNNTAQYVRLLRKYGIEKTDKRLGLIETSRRMGKSQSMKIHACAMSKNIPGLRTMYVSKDEFTCNQDYQETIDFALKIGANISCTENKITFKHDNGDTSWIMFKSGHAKNVRYICICFHHFFFHCFFFLFAVVNWRGTGRKKKIVPQLPHQIIYSINKHTNLEFSQCVLTFWHAIT
jgi:hypothetical protein